MTSPTPEESGSKRRSAGGSQEATGATAVDVHLVVNALSRAIALLDAEQDHVSEILFCLSDYLSNSLARAPADAGRSVKLAAEVARLTTYLQLLEVVMDIHVQVQGLADIIDLGARYPGGVVLSAARWMLDDVKPVRASRWSLQAECENQGGGLILGLTLLRVGAVVDATNPGVRSRAAPRLPEWRSIGDCDVSLSSNMQGDVNVKIRIPDQR